MQGFCACAGVCVLCFVFGGLGFLLLVVGFFFPFTITCWYSSLLPHPILKQNNLLLKTNQIKKKNKKPTKPNLANSSDSYCHFILHSTRSTGNWNVNWRLRKAPIYSALSLHNSRFLLLAAHIIANISPLSCGSCEEWLFLPVCVLQASKDSYLFSPMSPCVQSGLWHWWWLCHYFALGALAHLQSWCTSSLLRWHTSHIANASLALLPASLPDKNTQIQASFRSGLLCLWWAFIHLSSSSLFSVFLCKTDFQMSVILQKPIIARWILTHVIPHSHTFLSFHKLKCFFDSSCIRKSSLGLVQF